MRGKVRFLFFVLACLLLISLLVPAGTPTLAREQQSTFGPGNWCVAGGFQGWNNASDPLNDSANSGDLIANDGIYSLDYVVAAPGRYEFKVVECGNWDLAYPSQNSWFYTNGNNQSVKFTFDTNDYSGDAGRPATPTTNIVYTWGDNLPTAFTAVGDWQGWNNSDPNTALAPVGNGIYHLNYVVPTAGNYQAKIVQTGSWSEQFVADGRAADGPVIAFATAADNQEVVFILDGNTGRVTIAPNSSNGGNWCLAGGFQGWNNASTPLNDNGTDGDLLGGDGVYSLDYSVANPGRDEFKAVECGNWGNAYPSDNAWVITTAANQSVKFTFDTNDHSNDAGLPFVPTSNIVNAWDDTPTTFTVVGPWQGWDNGNPATAMTNLGNKQFLLNYTFDTPATYEAKATSTGGWDNQVGNDGRNKNAPTSFFDIFTAGDTAHFWLDGNQGRIAILTPPAGGAGHDNNIFWDDLGHDSRDTLYRTPSAAVPTASEVILRFRAASNDLTAAKVRVYNDRLNSQSLIPMQLVADDGTYEWWQATLPASNEPTVYWYRFMAIDGTATAYYEDDNSRDGGWGQPFGQSPDNSWQLTIYDPAFQTPDWVKNAVVYQIFPDRFRDGDSDNNTPAGTFFYNEPDGTIVRSNQSDWNEAICDPRDPNDCPATWSKNFYGGDLQGLIDQLDYLQNLGITAIYLNPIFESPSNHKYDTTDFGLIDDNFGDLALFQTLSTEAHNRGINLILDGVFNHTSSDSIYFDRYSRYANEGACESESSLYRDWYYFQAAPVPGTGVCAGDTVYTSWFGFDSLPKLDSSVQAVRDLIWAGGSNAIGRYWMQWADGWRLDVAGDVDPGTLNDPNNDYWEGFRTAVHQTNPDAYIVGEEWNVAASWTLGNEWDATMNYQFSSAILSFWRDEPFTDNDHNSGSSAGLLNPLSPSQLDAKLHNLEERYPPEAFYAMMNLLGSHDTNRALFMLDHNTDLNDPTLYQDPAYDWSDAVTRLKGVVLLQMTLPGAPTIYYGDEVGLVGPVAHDGAVWQDDPYNRQPFPWLDESGTPFYTHLQSQAGQDVLGDYYRDLIAARNAHPALRTGSFDTLLVDDANGVYGYGRLLADYSDGAVVVINRALTEAQNVTVSVAGYLPAGATFSDALNGGNYTVDGNGNLTLDVPAMSGAVLVSDGAMADAPAGVNDLAVTDERNGEIDLGWSAAGGADSYDIYRSLVSGGGYVWVANTPNTSYTDSGLQNAVTYYYVVVSRNDTTLLVSNNSNEVSAIPQHDLGLAWYNLQWPTEITHVISTLDPTDTIYGQLWIDGATGGNGPATGITAQVGYGATGSNPIDNPDWLWVAMSYNAPAGNNDEYMGSLLPDLVGDYDYVTRWSSNGGQNWHYSDLSGPGYNNNPGRLHVIPSDDLTAPAAPANLVVDGTTASSIGLAWDANSDADLAGYELFRQEAAEAFVKIATLDAAATSFSDENVATNATYDYYLTAFDTSWNRSDPSNTVQATAEPRMVALTVHVTVPDFTAGTVFIVGNQAEIGNWDPGAVSMNQSGPNTWSIDLSFLDGTEMEFKFTRGNWETVEKEADGNTEVPNRQLTVDYGQSGSQVVDLTVANWRDPLVTAHVPAGNAFNVPTDSQVVVVWSQPINQNATFTVADGNGNVAGSFTFTDLDQIITFTPDAPLTESTLYTVNVSGVQDAGGDNQQVPVQWQFLTAGPAAVSLSKTVSTDGTCGSDTSLTVDWSQSVTYCYTVTNTSGYTFTVHDLVDDKLGTLLSDFNYELAPLAATAILQTIDVPNESGDITNCATWTADDGNSNVATAQACATITVVAPTSVSLSGVDGQRGGLIVPAGLFMLVVLLVGYKWRKWGGYPAG